MMREPTARRRSPDSSRRRRAERRLSREQLAAAAAVAAGVVAAQPAPLLPQQIPPGSDVGDCAIHPPVSSSQTHTPTQHMIAPSSSQTHTPTQRQYYRSRADSTTSSPSSTSSSLVNVSRRSRFGIRNFFGLSSVKKVKKRRSFKRKNYSTSSVDSDLAYGNGYVSRSSTDSYERPSPSQHQQHAQYPQQHQSYSQPYTPGAFSQVSGAYTAPQGPYSPHHYSQHGHHAGQGYPPPLSHQYGQPPPRQEPQVGPDGHPVLKRVQTDEEIIAIGRKLSDLARAENLRDLERQGKSRPSRIVATAAAVSAFHRKNSGGTRGISSSRPNKSQTSSSDEEWESASDSDSDSDSPSSDSDSGLAYGSMPRFSDPILPPLTALAGTAGVMGAAIGAGSIAPTIISERPSEAIRPPDRKPSAVDPAMFGPVNSLRGYVNTPCGFRPGDYISPTQSQYQSPSLVHRVATEDPIPLPGSASNEALLQRQRQQQHGYDQPITAANLGTPVQIQAPKPRIPVSPQVLEERGSRRDHAEISTGSPRKRRDREREGDTESSISTALPAVVGAIGAAVVAGAVMSNKDEKRQSDDRRDEKPRRDDDYDRERRRRYEDDARRSTIDVNDKGDERYDRRDYDRPLKTDETRSDERYRDSRPSERDRERDRERDHDRRYQTPTNRDRHSQRESESKSGVGEVITPAVIGAVAGAVLAAGARRDSKTSPVHRASPSVERDFDDGYKERMRLEQEVKRHREESERHAREEKRLRDEYEVRMKELREKAEEEERRIREEKKKQEWIEQQERIVREQRKIMYQQERVANDERERAERDRKSRDADRKREREEKRALEASGGRDPSRDKERSRDRRKEVVVVVEGRPDVADSVPAPAPPRSEVSKGKEREVVPAIPPIAPEGKKKTSASDSLAPVAKKKSKEERRIAREELRKLLAETQKQIEAEKERARRLAELEAIQGVPSTVTGSSSQAPAVDPFQFQVPADAFPTPSYTPPTERPLTPAVRTVEPDWDRLEPEPEKEVRERLSRRESYELELARAQEIVDETNKSTIPADPATIAAAIAVVDSSDNNRERSRSRAPSRGRDREPVRDRVQEEADRVYRERKLAERMADEESRSRSVSPSPSVMDKYEDNGEDPVVRIVTPPEMKRGPPKKSVFDGPNADVRIDNVIMPHDLVKYQAPPAIPGVNPATMMPIFKSRDPSCERERPMLILVLPTPAVSPNPEKMMRAVSSSSTATVVDAEPPKEQEVPATPPRSPKKIIVGPRGEAVEVPDDYDTGRVRESPESRDASQERKPIKFKFGSAGKKTNTWSMMAAAIAGASAIAAKRKEEARAAEGSGSRAIEGDASSSAAAAVVEEKPKPDVVTAEPPTKERGNVPERQQRDISPVPTISEPPSTPPQQRRVVSIDLADERPPRVGPKPSSSSPSSTRMPGTFEEDVDFNAHVAAGLEASGFDPNLVIKNEEFRRRDSPRGPSQPIYVPPSVETIADATDSRGHSPGVVTAEPIELPIVPIEPEQDLDLSSRRSRRSPKDEYVDIPEHDEPPDRPRGEGFSGNVSSNLSREASSFQVIDQPKEESFRVVERELSSVESDPLGKTNGHHGDVKHTSGNSQQITENGDKQSFLARAGTSGDGAGPMMDEHLFNQFFHHPNAALPSFPKLEGLVYEGKRKAKDTEEPHWRRGRSISYGSQKIDPEVQINREIKPAIDPQYGDLLPLPPSEPASPDDPSFYKLDDFFPSLPESRPNTPPQEQRARSATVTSRHKGQGHVRTPSKTAVPLPLVMGRRSVPSSPRVGRSSPVQGVEQPYSPPKSRQGRPTSWDIGREYKPLWLIEKRAGEEKRTPNLTDYPALPESESEPPSSAPESPGFDAVTSNKDEDISYLPHGGLGLEAASLGALGALGAGRMLQDQLKIDVPLARSLEQQSSGFGSGETTPRGFAADDFAQSPEARRNNDIVSLEQMSPVGSVRHIERQPTADKKDDVHNLEQLSPVVLPFKAPARRLSLGDDLELLPALPASLPVSPLEKGPSPASLQKSPFGGPLEDLPYLPASPVKQSAEDDLQALPALPSRRALSPVQEAYLPEVSVETSELPSLPESSYGVSIEDKNLPHTREDGTELLLASSGPTSPVPSTTPQVAESPELAALPALPDSAPGSPIHEALPRSAEEAGELPPLPESRAESSFVRPLPSPVLAALPSVEQLEDASTLPALPQARPGTPDFERLPALPRSRAPSPVSMDLPALPDSCPGSPVVETLLGLPTSGSGSPVLDALPGLVDSTSFNPVPSTGPILSDLPALPDSRAETPALSDLPTSSEPVLVPAVSLDLPALPDSVSASPIETELLESRSSSPAIAAFPALPETQPSASSFPALEEDRPASPSLADFAGSAENRSVSPVFDAVLALPENSPLSPALPDLPAQPESKSENLAASTETAVAEDEPTSLYSEPASPISPLRPTLSATRSLGTAFPGLPTLPKSRPASPVLSPSSALPESKPAVTAVSATPALSESRPATLAPSFTQRPRSGSHFFTTLFSLPVLSGVQSLSKSRPSSPHQKPSLANETLEEIPALPLSESGPVSPIDDLSKSLAQALEKVSESRAEPESPPISPVELSKSPHKTVEDLSQLPALPDSQPASPLELPESSVQTLQHASRHPALPESRPLSPVPKFEDLSELPALPESSPVSPIEEPLPVVSASQAVARGFVHSPATENLNELLALPESRPVSPPLGSELPALPESRPVSPVIELTQHQPSPVLQHVAAENLDSLPALPESKPISPVEPSFSQDLETQPALLDTNSVSPVLGPARSQDLEAPPIFAESNQMSPFLEPVPAAESESLPALCEKPLPPLSENERTPAVHEVTPTLELESLPALPESIPGSPVLEPATTQVSESLSALSESRPKPSAFEPVFATEPQNLPAFPEGSPISPDQPAATICQLPDNDLDDLPALPESQLASPVDEPVSSRDLEITPALLDSQPISPVLVSVSSQPFDESLTQLPALPESQPDSPIVEPVPSHNLPALPSSQPVSPVQVAVPSQIHNDGLNDISALVEPQPISTVNAPVSRQIPVERLDDLPALPESQPASPIKDAFSNQLSDEPLDSSSALFRPRSAYTVQAVSPQLSLDSLPALPDSRPLSPVQPNFSDHLAEQNPEAYPALPESQPPSPRGTALPALRDSRSPSLQTTHAQPITPSDDHDVSALPASQQPSSVEVPASHQFPSLDFDSLPALPESLPVSPAEVPVSSQLFKGDFNDQPALSDSPPVSSVQDLAPQLPGEDLDQLPSLAESRPDSPVFTGVRTPPNDRSLSPVQVSLDRLPEEDIAGFPALADGRPLSPVETPDENFVEAPAEAPVEALMENPVEDLVHASAPELPEEASDKLPALLDSPLVFPSQDLDQLPALPESRSISPVPAPALSELSILDGLPALPDSRPVSPIQNFEDLPALPESQPMSPVEDSSFHQLPKEDLDQLPARTDRPPVSAVETASPQINAVEAGLADLPPLPASLPASPVQKPALPLIATDLDKPEPTLSAKAAGKEVAGVQEQDFASLSQVKDGNADPLYEPPSSYSDIKTPPSPISSPISKRAFEKGRELEEFDKGKPVLLDTGAAAGTAGTLVVANMRHDGPQPGTQRLGSEMQIPPSQEKSESVYSFNEDGASTIAASEAPTYLSGLTFYESQLPEATKKKDSPRQTFSSLLGLWSKREKTQPEPPAVSKVVAKVVPATTSEEEMSEDDVARSPSKKERKKRQKGGEMKERSGSRSGSQQEQQRGESSGGLNILSSNQSTNDQPASSIVNKPVASRYLPDDEPSPSSDQQFDEPVHDTDLALESEEVPTIEKDPAPEEVPATQEAPTPSKKSKKKKKRAKKAALESADVAEEQATPEVSVAEREVAASEAVPSEIQQPRSSGELDSAMDKDPSPKPVVTDDVDEVELAEREENVPAAPSRSGSASSPTTRTLTRDLTKKGILSMLPAASPFRPGLWGMRKQEPVMQSKLEEGPELQSQQTERGLGLGESSDRSGERGPAEDVHKPEVEAKSGPETASLALAIAMSLAEGPTLVQDEAKVAHDAEKELSDERLQSVDATITDVNTDKENKDFVQSEDKETTAVANDEPTGLEEPVQDILIPETAAVPTSNRSDQKDAVLEPSTISAVDDVVAAEPSGKKSKKKKKKKKATAAAVEIEETATTTNAPEQSGSKPVAEPFASSGASEKVVIDAGPAAETSTVQDIAVVPDTPVDEAAPTEITPGTVQVEEIPALSTTSSKKSKKKKKKKNASQSTETRTTVPADEEPQVSDTTVQQPPTDPEPETKQSTEDTTAASIPADDAILGQQEPQKEKRQSVSIAEPLEEHNIPGQVSRDSSEQPNSSNSKDSTTPRGEDDNKPHQTEAHPVSEIFPSSLSPAQLPEKINQNSQETVGSELNEISSDRQDGVAVAIPLDLLLFPANHDAAVQDVSKEEPGFDAISLQQEQEPSAAPPLTTEPTPELEPATKEEADTGDGLTEPKSTHDATSDSDAVERGVTAPLVAVDSTTEPLTNGASGSTAVTQPEPIATEEAAALASLPDDDTVDSIFPTVTMMAEEEKTSPINEEQATSSVAQGDVQQPQERQAETPVGPAAAPLQVQPQLGTIAVPPPQQLHPQQQETSFQAPQPIQTAAVPIDATQLHEVTLAPTPITSRPRSVSFALEAISPGSYTPTSSGAMSPVTEHESEDAAGASSRYSLRGKKREKRKKSTALKTAAIIAAAASGAEAEGWPTTLLPAFLASIDSPQQVPFVSREGFEHNLHQLGTVAEETEPPSSTSATENNADSISDGRSVLSLSLEKRAETPSEFGGSMVDSEGTTGERQDEAGSSGVANGLMLVARLKRVAGRMREKREKAALKKKSAISWPSSDVLEAEQGQQEDEVAKEVAQADETAEMREQEPDQAEEAVQDVAVEPTVVSLQAGQTVQDKAVDLKTPSQETEEIVQEQTAEPELSSEQTVEVAQNLPLKPESPVQQTEEITRGPTVEEVPTPGKVAPVPEETAPVIEPDAIQTPTIQESTPAIEIIAPTEPTTNKQSAVAPKLAPTEEPVTTEDSIATVETMPAVDKPTTAEEHNSVSKKAFIEEPPVNREAIQEEVVEAQPKAAPEPTIESLQEEVPAETVQELTLDNDALAQDTTVSESESRAVEELTTEPQLETFNTIPETTVKAEAFEEVEPTPIVQEITAPEPLIKTALEPEPEAAFTTEPVPTVEEQRTAEQETVAPVLEQATPNTEVTVSAAEEPINTAGTTIDAAPEGMPVSDRNIVLDSEPQVQPELTTLAPEAEPSTDEADFTRGVESDSVAQPEPVAFHAVKDAPEQIEAIVKLEPEVITSPVQVAETEQRPPQRDELAEAMTIALPEEAEESFDFAPLTELEQTESRLDELAEVVTIPLPEDSVVEEPAVSTKEPEPQAEVEAKAKIENDVAGSETLIIDEAAPIPVENLAPAVGEVAEEPASTVEDEPVVTNEEATSLPEEPVLDVKEPIDTVMAEDQPVAVPAEETPAIIQQPTVNEVLVLASGNPLPEATADELELPVPTPAEEPIPTVVEETSTSAEVAAPEAVEEVVLAVVEEPTPVDAAEEVAPDTSKEPTPAIAAVLQPDTQAATVLETLEEPVEIEEPVSTVEEPVAIADDPVVEVPVVVNEEEHIAEDVAITAEGSKFNIEKSAVTEDASISREVSIPEAAVLPKEATATDKAPAIVEESPIVIEVLAESSSQAPDAITEVPPEEMSELPAKKKGKKKKKKTTETEAENSGVATSASTEESTEGVQDPTIEPTIEQPYIAVEELTEPTIALTVSEEPVTPFIQKPTEPEFPSIENLPVEEPAEVIEELIRPPVSESQEVAKPSKKSKKKKKGSKAGSSEPTSTVATPSQEFSNPLETAVEKLFLMLKSQDELAKAKTGDDPQSTLSEATAVPLPESDTENELILAPETSIVESTPVIKGIDAAPETPEQELKVVPSQYSQVIDVEVESEPSTIPESETSRALAISEKIALLVQEPISETSELVKQHTGIPQLSKVQQESPMDKDGTNIIEVEPVQEITRHHSESEQLLAATSGFEIAAETATKEPVNTAIEDTSITELAEEPGTQDAKQEVEIPASAKPAPVEEVPPEETFVPEASKLKISAPFQVAEAVEIAPIIQLPTAFEKTSDITPTSQVAIEQQDDESSALTIKEYKKQKRKKNKNKGKKIEVDGQPETSPGVTSATEPVPEPAPKATAEPASESTPQVVPTPIVEPVSEPLVQPVSEAVAETISESATPPTIEETAVVTPINRQLSIEEPIVQQLEPRVEDPFDDDFLPLPTKKSKKSKKKEKSVPAVIDDHDGGSGVTTPLVIEEHEQAPVAGPDPKHQTVLVQKRSNRSLNEVDATAGGAPIAEPPVLEEVLISETPTVELSVVEASDVETPSAEDAPVVEVVILDAETAPVAEVEVLEETPTVEQEPVFTEAQGHIAVDELIIIEVPKPVSRPQTPVNITREAELTPLPPSRPQTPVLEEMVESSTAPLPSTPANQEFCEHLVSVVLGPETTVMQKQAENLAPATPAPVTTGKGLLPEIALLPPISLERTPPRSFGEQVDLTPAQGSSHISHEPPFEYQGRRKKVKTAEAEKVELAEPAVSAMDVAASHASVTVDESPNKEENKEKTVASATAAIGGGVSLLDKLEGKEKEDWRVMGGENISVLTSGWDDMGSVLGSVLGGAPVYHDGEGDWKEAQGSLFDEEDEPKAEKNSRGLLRNLTESGLGRMDSETIPRSLRESSGTKTEDSHRGRKMERGKSSPSPEPVQRSFSFPDDIADEEAFETRDITADDKKEHVREMVPVADQPVRLPRMSSFGDFMRSHASLPPVQEELSEEEEPKKQRTPVRPAHRLRRTSETLDPRRDSGFSGDSPRVSQGLQPGETEHLRDSGVSGVHLATPRNSTKVDRQKRRSPLSGTVRLLEPSPPPHTREPEKSVVASAVGSSRSAKRIVPNTSLQRLRTPEPLRPDSPGSAESVRSHDNATPPLRRMGKRTSGNLRSGSSSQTELAAKAREQGHGQNSADLSPAMAIAATGTALGALAAATSTATSSTSSTSPPIANEGRARAAKDMSDVFEAVGEGRMGSPRSPTRPHSMRRRQSLQVIELEARVEQLIHENQQLAQSRAQAQSQLARGSLSSNSDREYEIEHLKRALQEANEVIERLKQTNEGLRNSTSAIAVQHHEEIRRFEAQQAHASKELQKQARSAKEKDAEIAHLRAQLEASADEIKRLQQQILEQSRASVNSDFLDVRDIDYFDHRCQQLCAHVSQWVLRFSKFSDMRACRLTNELSDEKLIDRLDNAVLDGSNVDTYLNDRVRRRDIFMSMTMTMIWEFVFTRYLFGMDREQRQKLKHLEKQLVDVGPPHAVRQWRAVTLTLLSRRPGFKRQRDQDTEAVVQAILDTLAKILPPPSNLEDQIQAQLRRVIREAVGLAIEMRCQRAEYIMLPPLQPEYDDAGELVEDVKFNAALMNDGGQSNLTNEELESTGATVRVVLFPLVLRKGDDEGRGDDEIVVTPAQVLVARSAYASPATPTQSLRGKNVRLLTPISDAGGASVGGRSPKQERGPRQLPSPPGQRGDVSMRDHEGYI